MKDFDQEFALVKKRRVNVSFKKSIDSMSMFVDKSPGKLNTAFGRFYCLSRSKDKKFRVIYFIRHLETNSRIKTTW